MTIERIHFIQPLPIDMLHPPTNVELAKAAMERPSTIQSVQEGTYDISPDPRTLGRHELIALQDGTGEYRIIPRHAGIGSVANIPGQAGFKSGGRTFRLAEGSSAIGVVSTIPGTGQLGVYDVLVYHPGPPPRPTRGPGQQGRRGS